MLSAINLIAAAAPFYGQQIFPTHCLTVWQTGRDIIIQSQNGCKRIPSPGAYNSYPDYMILSADGQYLALPVRSDQGMSLYAIVLITRGVTELGRFRQADLPRISPDGRYVEVLTDNGIELCDVATKQWRRLGKKLTNVAWSLSKNILFYSDQYGAIYGYDPSKSVAFQPSTKLVDDLIGASYRSSVLIKQRLPTTEISPSGKWAFLGALEGGIVPWEINGRYYDGIGDRVPYRYGFMDGHWNLKTFSAPNAYDTDEFYPISWTSSEELVMVDPELKDRILIVDPDTGKSRFQILRPPVKGAALIAMSCWGSTPGNFSQRRKALKR